MHQLARHAALLQLLEQRLRADQRVLGALVEPAHHLIAPLQRHDRNARAQVLGVARVEAGGEAQALAAQPADGPEAERSFGRDVDRVGLERLDARDRAPGIVGDADLRVRRQRKRAVRVGRDHQHLGPLRLQVVDQAHQRVDDAVGLRLPRVGHQHQAPQRLLRLGQRRPGIDRRAQRRAGHIDQVHWHVSCVCVR